MNNIDTIRLLLHHAAELLVWPVMGGLLALAAACVISLGSFAKEAVDRRRKRYRSLSVTVARLDEIAFHAREPGLEWQLEKALQEENHRRWVSLHRSRIPIRLGPSLGLMGTLIPMASALAALSGGDLPSLAKNMVTAFAATVVGLAISVVSYGMASFREEWVRRDCQAAALHAESLLPSSLLSAREEAVALR